MVENDITVYGTQWCGDCLRTRRLFETNHIVYKWIDIDDDDAGEDFVITTNNGMRSVPTIVFEDGSILVEPAENDLQQKLALVMKTS